MLENKLVFIIILDLFLEYTSINNIFAYFINVEYNFCFLNPVQKYVSHESNSYEILHVACHRLDKCLS